jgi:hypothetical protein
VNKETPKLSTDSLLKTNKKGDTELTEQELGKNSRDRETVSGTDFGDRMGRGSGQFAESALDTLYVARNRG